MSFSQIEREGVVFHTCDRITVPHAFTTRLGGVSEGAFASLNLRLGAGDAQENVEENYRRLFAALELPPERAVGARQQHHDHIRAVTEEDAGKLLCRPCDFEDVDALITNVPALPLVVYSADCGITLLHDPVSRCIGAVHSGWRGVALGILPKTVEELCRRYGARVEDLRIAMGASICQDCFETDADVPQAMLDAIGSDARRFIVRRGAKWHVDLRGINRCRLAALGIAEEQIDALPLCTACHSERYWSHRRHGNRRGVQGAVIALRGE